MIWVSRDVIYLGKPHVYILCTRVVCMSGAADVLNILVAQPVSESWNPLGCLRLTEYKDIIYWSTPQVLSLISLGVQTGFHIAGTFILIWWASTGEDCLCVHRTEYFQCNIFHSLGSMRRNLAYLAHVITKTGMLCSDWPRTFALRLSRLICWRVVASVLAGLAMSFAIQPHSFFLHSIIYRQWQCRGVTIMMWFGEKRKWNKGPTYVRST